MMAAAEERPGRALGVGASPCSAPGASPSGIGGQPALQAGSGARGSLGTRDSTAWAAP